MIGGSDFGASFVGPKGRDNLLSEINVTPMVDVMLVLVIVFIVTGQVVVSGTDVQLPDAKADQIALKEEPIEVSLNSEGAIFLGKTPVTPEAFEDQMAALAAAPKAREEQRVLVRADRSLPYGNVMKIVSVVSEAGFSRVAFVSDPPSLSNMAEAP